MAKKRVTSFDVANKSGVSRTTVSLVLNNIPDIRISQETKQRVLEAATELGYHPDSAGRKLASGRSSTIGLVLRQSREQVFADALLPQVVLGVAQAVEAEDFQIMLKALEPARTDGYMHLIQENHVDGIILSGPQQKDDEIVRLFRDGFPIVLMGQLPGSNLPFVDIDAIAGSESAVRHLIDYGHQLIAMITNAPLEYTSAQQRYTGYRNALSSTGIKIEDAFLQEGNYTPASGHTAMERLLKLPTRPTAVFVSSDVVAVGAMQAIKEAGLRIPEDISIVGFDDIPLSDYFDPPLTTVKTPSYGLGWTAGEILIRLVQGHPLEKSEVLLDSKLVVRGSSAPWKGAAPD
jgi:LacI family transcriptional regulator